MYNKDFFQQHFALTPLQADDYAAAFQRICYLLQDHDPLHKHRRNFFYGYQKEAFDMLSTMPGVTNMQKAQLLLEKGGFRFANPSLPEAEQAARALLSIADSFIWPAFVYEDWKETQEPNKKEIVKSKMLVASINTTQKRKQQKSSR